MATVESTVTSYYGQGGLLGRILGGLKEAGIDPERPTVQELYRFDQLHGRGIVATREHAEAAGIGAGAHVLDLGCGIGGASRFLAERGCRVTGVDLTPEFIEVARELTRRCGLAGRIEFRVANALDLPFPDASFDHVWSHNVTMNIADKAGFAREAARVLKPGGRFSCAEVERGPAAGGPNFPLPWASEPSSSFLATPADMRAALEDAGLSMVAQNDMTESGLAFAREAAERAGRGEPPVAANHFAMGDDMRERSRNMVQALRDGALVEQIMVAEKG